MRKTALLTCALALLLAYTPVALGDPSDYNSFCYACVSQGYEYCRADNLCRSGAGCLVAEYTSRSSCPAISPCGLGVSGVAFLGDTGSQGGIDTSGSMTISVGNDKPCYIAVYN